MALVSKSFGHLGGFTEGFHKRRAKRRDRRRAAGQAKHSAKVTVTGPWRYRAAARPRAWRYPWRARQTPALGGWLF